MNGSSTINEQLIGKFHVVNVEKLPVNNHEEIITPTSSITDETGCASRFQMIRVDRNFGRGRWKVNDYEPPENTSMATIPSINTIENDSSHLSNVQSTTIPMIPSNIPTVSPGDSNTTSSTTLAASVAAATAYQQQQRIALNNTPNVGPTPPTGLLHAYPPAALANQSYHLLPNHHHHHQFGYFPFYASPYGPYATPWTAAALAASNPYLQPPTLAQPQTASQIPSTANLNDPLRLTETVSDINGENTFLTPDHIQNAQLAAYLYAIQHSQYMQQASSTTSSYATIPSYHPPHLPPSILPPQTLSLSQTIPYNTTDIQQSYLAPLLSSPKHDGTKNLLHHSSLITTPKPLVPTIFNGINHDSTRTTHVNDLISSSPAPPSLISPINIHTTNAPTTNLSDIWTYTSTGSPLNLTQTAQTGAVDAMSLLNNDTSRNTEIANEILKELTTPTKQNNFTLSERRACLRLRRKLSTTDIDIKISAAMDLVKMHLLSAVREEVTELRQQIRMLNEKMNIVEHENTFLRQYVPSEIYAQYIPPFNTLSSSNDSTNSITNNVSIIPPLSSSSSSQPVPMTSLPMNPSSLVQQATLPINQQTILPTPNFPLT